MLSTFVAQLINGLTIGSFYALVALGYSMVYGVMKLINFAHGDLFALGSYLGYSFLVALSGIVSAHLGLWAGLAVAAGLSLVATAGAGLMVERLAYRPVYKAGRLPLVVSALGISIVIENLIMVVWGPRYQTFPAALVPQSVIAVGDFHVSVLQVVILALSFVLFIVVFFLIEKTDFGLAVRASALDKDTATIMGVDFRKVIFFVFALGPGLGGVAGVMVGSYYGRIMFTMGWGYGLKAFTASILGGIGNIPGAMLGGLLLGLLETFFSGYVSSAWKDVFVTLVLIIVLIVKPTGILGEKTAEKV
jgi:branched-chain amino acid transport system permease protein